MPLYVVIKEIQDGIHHGLDKHVWNRKEGEQSHQPCRAKHNKDAEKVIFQERIPCISFILKDQLSITPVIE